MSDIVQRLSVLNGEHYGSSKNQKGIAKRKPVSGKNDRRGDFDATSPSAQSALYAEIVLDTHVTANLLSYLLFNRYQMSTSAYRETKNRLADMDWKTCRQNLVNWTDKGAIQLNKLLPALKQIALQDGADVNVDETWERYQTHYDHRKTYIMNRLGSYNKHFYDKRRITITDH